MNAAAGIALTIGLLVLNALFVAAEFALVGARRSQLEAAAQRGSRRAGIAVHAMERLSMMLAGVQLGITLCSVALGAISEPVIAGLLRPPIAAVGLPAATAHAVAFAIALALVTMLHVVFGEMVAKNATMTAPDRVAVWLAPPLTVVVRVLRPVIWLLNETTNLCLRALRVEPRPDVVSTVTSGQFAGELDQSRREGLVAGDDAARAAHAVDFERTTAGDVALPLSRVHSLPRTATTIDVETLAARTGVTRFPVRVGESLIGYVHLKDVLTVPGSRRREPLTDRQIRPLPTVTTTAHLPAAIETLRASRAHLARIVDPGDRGRTIGILALDDVLSVLTASP